jgi:hypothetical protein
LSPRTILKRSHTQPLKGGAATTIVELARFADSGGFVYRR